jgi:hydrogenase-4 component E
VSEELFVQLVATTTGLLLLTAVLQVWRRSLAASVRLLAVQGAALAGLVATIGVAEAETEVVAVAALVLAIKAGLVPWALARTARVTAATREDAPLVNPTVGLILAALLTLLAFVVSQPVVAVDPGPAAAAVPVGVALVLIGFLVLVTRRMALSQLIGFVVLDNGIATVAFLTAGGVPLVVELGVTLDVLLVVLILRVLTARMQLTTGDTDLDDLTELRD